MVSMVGSRRRDGRCLASRDLAYVHGPKTVAAFRCVPIWWHKWADVDFIEEF
jgi:hypothetical protein